MAVAFYREMLHESAVMPQCVVRLSVPLSVCLTFRYGGVGIAYFEKNCTAEWLKAPVHIDLSMGHLVQREHPYK